MEQPNSRQKTFELEMMPHVKELHSYALRLSRDPDDAKDLVQETLLNAYRYFDKYTPGTNAAAWLYRIMKNHYINRYRRASREPDKVRYEDVVEFYPAIKGTMTETNNIQDEMLGGQFDDEVAEALQNLHEDFRTVMILSDIEEYTYEEIADFVEIPIGTVRSRLHRGRKMMKSLLRDYALKHGFREKENRPTKSINFIDEEKDLVEELVDVPLRRD